MTVPEDTLVVATQSAAAERQASAATGRMQQSMPSREDAEEFSSKVNEISRLVDGLAKGTLTPEYVDAKMEREKVKAASKPVKVRRRLKYVDEPRPRSTGLRCEA